uniref:Uncharacterized protein n=1 Tax=Glossina austeni TaxID=7395 RepID=A0A1A9VDK4_GLOAU
MHKQTTASYPPHHTINQSSRDKDMKPRPNEYTIKRPYDHTSNYAITYISGKLYPKTNIGMKIDIVNIVKCHCQLVLSALSERPPCLPACLPCCQPTAYLLSFSPLWASSYGIRLCSRVYYMLQIDNVVTIIVANVQLLVVAAKNRLENL